jgi:hypothetical protein
VFDEITPDEITADEKRQMKQGLTNQRRMKQLGESNRNKKAKS